VIKVNISAVEDNNGYFSIRATVMRW